MVWYFHHFQNLPQFIIMHTVKGFDIVNNAEIGIFFFWSPLAFSMIQDCCIWISGSSAFAKNSLNIWKFTVHVLMKPGLENIEHYSTRT